MVKAISLAVKGHFRELVRVKRALEQEGQRVDDFNRNIIEECDFSRKDAGEEIEAMELDV